jgi:hypothetical protein
MQAGKKAEADLKKAKSPGLKNEHSELEKLRDEGGSRKCAIDWSSSYSPNIPQADVPVGTEATAT